MKPSKCLLLIPALLATTLGAMSAEPSGLPGDPNASDSSSSPLEQPGANASARRPEISTETLPSVPPEVRKIISSSKSWDQCLHPIVSYLGSLSEKKKPTQIGAIQAAIAIKLIEKYPQARGTYRWSSPYDMLLEGARQCKPGLSQSLVQQLLRHYPLSYKDDVQWRAEAHLALLDNLGKPLEYSFTSIDGQEVDSTKLKGEVILACFDWANKPEAYTELNKIYKQLHGRGFEILTMSSEKDETVLQGVARQCKVTWPVCSSQQSQKVRNNCKGVTWWPAYLLIDKRGNLADYQGGEDIEVKIKQLMRE